MNVRATKRGRYWGLRFRLSKDIAESLGLPVQVRMKSNLLANATAAEVTKEETRVAALLELLCRGQTELNGSLASYLGLPEPPGLGRLDRVEQ